MNDPTSIIAAVIAGGGAVISATSAIVARLSRIGTLAKQETQMRKDFETLRATLMHDVELVRNDIKNSTTALYEAITMFKVMSAESQVVNRITATTLSSLTGKFEGHDKRLNELEGSISLISELLHAKGILG